MDFVQELGLLALGSRFRRLSDRLMAGVQQAYRNTGVDFEPRWFLLFRALADHGPMTVGVCARMLGLTHAAVSQTAAALVKEGLVSSTRDPQDERRRLLELSEQGRAALPELQPIWEDVHGAVHDMVEFSGVDILSALDGLEQALVIQGVSGRVASHRTQRLLAAVEIVDLVEEPALRAQFHSLNEAWITKYFEMESEDHRILNNPETIIDDGGAVFFAKVRDEQGALAVAGTCALVNHNGTWELCKMAVNPAFHRRKVGLKLALTALDRARQQGIERVFLLTDSKLKAAIALYRKVGFRMAPSHLSDQYARGDVTMEIDLA